MVLSIWTTPEDDKMQIEWTRSLSGQIEPLAVGHYFNHVGMEADDAGDTARTALGANYARLSKLKAKYDPTNFFRHNQNIKPAQ